MQEKQPNKNRIDEVLATAMTKIKTLIDVNTVIGNAEKLDDGTTVIPVSKITLGILAGGGEYGDSTKSEEENFAGGSGACAAMNPVGFLVITNSEIKFIKIDGQSTNEKVVDIAFELLSKYAGKVKQKCETSFL